MGSFRQTIQRAVYGAEATIKSCYIPSGDDRHIGFTDPSNMIYRSFLTEKTAYAVFFLLSEAVQSDKICTIENPINIVGIDLTKLSKLAITNNS